MQNEELRRSILTEQGNIITPQVASAIMEVYARNTSRDKKPAANPNRIRTLPGNNRAVPAKSINEVSVSRRASSQRVVPS